MDETLDLSVIDRLVLELGRGEEVLIPLLQAVQKEFKYLPETALRHICEISEITPAQIEGVASFFSQFRRTPVGKHTVRMCDGTACHVKGSEAIYKAMLRKLEIESGDTDADGLFTVQKVACLGCCTLAPAVQIDEVTYGHVRTDTVGRILTDFLENEANRKPKNVQRDTEGISLGEVRIGLGSCCVAGGSAKIRDVLDETLAKLDYSVDVKPVGCVGMCHQTPLLEVVIMGEDPVMYAKVKPEDVPEIISQHFWSDNPLIKARLAVENLLQKLYTPDARNVPERYSIDVREAPVSDFLDRQEHLATESCGFLNPTDMSEYRGLGGFTALKSVLKSADPDGLIENILESGLRGRGGGGFPTGKKWAAVREAAASGKTPYLVCNGDEGDPGAFMDRMILESYPFRMIEGLIIASYAVGAHEGILYIRAEYPLAIKRIQHAITECEKAGFLGDNIMGSGHAFTLSVFEGAGAFVCGEESALIQSLEGHRGMPNYRPPFPAEKGLHGAPTLVNNVETFSLIPWIIRHGVEAFRAFGTEKSRGTKVFSLAGKIKRGGLIEVPMGITIREVVEEIGGGVADDRTFKAVQIGGPSGGCIPASMSETTVDFEALVSVGAMMGSGGFVVLDDRDCMVEMSHYFLSFTQHESCGKCTPCRVGTKRMLEILTRLCEGRGEEGDLERLEDLAQMVKAQSLCGLGKTASNPILTNLAYFREEFEAHIQGVCPAGKCVALIRYSINDSCIGCTKCAQACPVDAITRQAYSQHEINQEKCVKCDTCRTICPVGAVELY